MNRVVIFCFFTLNYIFTGLVFSQEQQSRYDSQIQLVKQYLYSNTDSARYFLETAQELVGENKEGQIEVNKLYGVYYETLAQYDSAIQRYQDNSEIALEMGSEEAIADATYDIGRSLSAKGNLVEAQGKLMEALDYYKANNLPEKQANVYNDIGIILHKSGDLAAAKSTYKRAIEIHPGEHYKALSRLAVAYENENSLDSAYVIYKRLSKIYEESNNLRNLFSTYINMAIVYEKLGQSDTMIYYYNTAANLAKNLNYIRGLAGVYHNLVRAHFILGNYATSQAYLDSAYQAARDSKELEVFTKLKGDEAFIAQEKGNYRKAAFLYEEFFLLKDSLNAQKQAKTIQELNIKYETASNKQRIAELQLTQKDTALSLARSKNQRNLFVSGFAIVLIVAGFLFYLYSNKKKISDILSVKNDQISTALAEREILLKEIHHRVKNNLQVISSLLYLQAESLADEAAIDAVRQGQHRVEAMGLIHQRLYSADDVRGVDIQGYFEQLCEEIITVFGDEDKEIDYHVDTNQLKLDIDTVIPLGLIVNELITNALKYAFKGRDAGTIKIEVSQELDKLIVVVKDNGKGMTEESLKTANSFGWKMMRSLSRKIQAEMIVKNDNGTTVELRAGRYKLV